MDEVDPGSFGTFGRVGRKAWPLIVRHQPLLLYDGDRRVLRANARAHRLFAPQGDRLAGLRLDEMVRPGTGPVEAWWEGLVAGDVVSRTLQRASAGGAMVETVSTFALLPAVRRRPAMVIEIACETARRPVPDVDEAARLAAIERAQFTLELGPDGTVLAIGDRLAGALGIDPSDALGRAHRTLVVAGAEAAVAHGGRRTIAYRKACGGALLIDADIVPVVDRDGVPARSLLIGSLAGDRAIGDRRKGGPLVAVHRPRPDPVARPAAKAADGSVAVAEELARCAATVAPLAREHGTTLRCEAAPEVPPCVALDRESLRAVLLMLAGRAVIASGGQPVSVTAEPAWDDPALLSIAIAGALGSGFALPAPAHDLAAAMSGRLCLRDIGHGAVRIELRLPLSPIEHDDAYAGADPALVPRCDAPRVLVAEDNTLNQVAIERRLAALGARVEIVADGVELLRAVETAERAGDPFRLVLTNPTLPGLDGVEAARRLRAKGHGARFLPILALTANARAADVAMCRAAGMQGHLAKPVEAAELAAALDRYVPRVGRPHAGPREAPSIPPPRVADLAARYAREREETLARLDRLARGDGQCDAASIDTAADDLAALGAMAGQFGEGTLGQAARDWSARLRQAETSAATEIVRRAVRALRSAT